VAVTAIAEFPALEACRDGVRDALKAAGYKEGQNLKFAYENAHGDLTTATKIARKFAAEKPSVIVPISTPSAQAVIAATIGIPVVFTAVTDPLGAQLVRDMYRPGSNVTGMTDLAPVEKQIKLIRQVTPKAQTIGLPYNPNEANAVTLHYLMRRTAQSVNMRVIDAIVRSSSEVPAAAEGLVGKADVIFVPTDNTVVPALASVIKVAIDNKIPVYAGDINTVKRGAMAAVGFEYYSLGWETGNIVVSILKGAKPGEIPVRGIGNTDLYLNPAMAAKMGVTFSDAIVSQATKVIE
jgi:putative ABC transport system substrate-binding protein